MRRLVLLIACLFVLSCDKGGDGSIYIQTSHMDYYDRAFVNGDKETIVVVSAERDGTYTLEILSDKVKLKEKQ